MNADADADDADHSVRPRMRRNVALGGYGTTPADMLKNPDGVRVKSAGGSDLSIWVECCYTVHVQLLLY